MDDLTDDQKAECLALGQAIERVKTFPGGVRFVTDLLSAVAAGVGLAIVEREELEEIEEAIIDSAAYLKDELDSDEPEILESKWLDGLMQAHGQVLGMIEVSDIALGNVKAVAAQQASD